MLRINVGEGSFPPENGQCQTGKLVRLFRYFTPGNYSDPVVRDPVVRVSKYGLPSAVLLHIGRQTRFAMKLSSRLTLTGSSSLMSRWVES